MRLNKQIIFKKLMPAAFLVLLIITNAIISVDITSLHLESTEKQDIILSPRKDFESNLLDPSDPMEIPQSAAEYVIFDNDLLFIVLNESGFIDYHYYNLWFEGFYHSYYQMFYLSVNEGTVYSLEDFNITKTLTNISNYEYGNFDLPILTEVILEHDVAKIQLKIHVKLYPDKEYFIMTFYISSQTLIDYKAEFFMYADLDIDETYDDDFAGFNGTSGYIFQSDPATDNTVGWSSPVYPSDWDIGAPNTIEANVINDKLKNSAPVVYQDYGIATKYESTSLQVGETWGIPIIFGFGVGENAFQSNTYEVQDQFVDDFAVLDFSTNLSINPSLNATILNGGTLSESRSVRVLRNNTEIASSTINLAPGEVGSMLFEDLDLFPGKYNEISVEVENSGTEFATNDALTETVLFNRKIDFHITDLEGNDIENVNVSIYNQIGEEYQFSSITDSVGLGKFSHLMNGDYTAKVIFPWIQDQTLQCVAETNFSIPGSPDVIDIQTNTTTLTLQILDLEDNPVKNASISIFNNETLDFLWEGTTDSQGNITFHYLNSSYDVFIDYHNYQQTLDLGGIQDVNLSNPLNLTQNVNLINITLHFITREFQENMTGAKIEFYNRTSDDSFGEPIGYEIADENGNVTIQWTNSIDYAITVSFFSEDQPVGETDALAHNFTGSPFSNYLYANLNVSLGGGDLEDFTTELVLFNNLPIKYIWDDLIDLKFMFNVTGPTDYEGPIWANETTILIRNSQYEVVYLGNASIIPSQQGNHSFIVNTSSGYFTSANPEIYSIEISAEVYGYSSPNSIQVNFNIYNISTQLTLAEPSTSIIWKDNFTITASYNDTVNDIPIIGGTVTATWNEFLINAPMIMTSPGIYTITIDSSIGIPGTDNVIITAMKPHYNQRSTDFGISVNNIPTTVNESNTLYTSEHFLYVTMENLTLDYAFYDSYRNISIPDLDLTFELEHSTTEEVIEGNLLYQNGLYVFDPQTASLVIGTYNGFIIFHNFGYISSYASIQIVISEIPTMVNSSQLEGLPVNLFALSPLSFDFNFTNGVTNNSIEGAITTFEITDTSSSWVAESGSLSENLPGIYDFSPTTENFPIGTYQVDLTFTKANFSTTYTGFLLFIELIPTSVNDTSLSVIPYTVYYGNSLQFSFQYFDSYRNIFVENIIPSYTISHINNSEIISEYSGILTDFGNDEYLFAPNFLILPIGAYTVDIEFSKQNYTTQIVEFSFEIKEIPFILNITETLREAGVSEDSNELKIVQKESIELEIETHNIWGNEVEDCVVTYTISKDGQVWEGSAIELENGNYLVNLSIFEDPGLYSLTIHVTKTNYSTEEFHIFINVEYPTFLGLATPYWLIIGIASAVLISSVVGYITIRKARIPRYIKNLTLLEKLMKNPKGELHDRFLTRTDQMQAKYGNRWMMLDLDAPFKSSGDAVSAFIQKYHEATGKMLITEDAIQYLNDVSIYSQGDIKTRLSKEGVSSDNLMIDIVELISNYMQNLSQTTTDLDDSAELIDDMGIDWDLGDKANQNEGGNQ